MEMLVIPVTIIACAYVIKVMFGIYRDFESNRQMKKAMKFFTKTMNKYTKLLEDELGD